MIDALKARLWYGRVGLAWMRAARIAASPGVSDEYGRAPVAQSPRLLRFLASLRRPNVAPTRPASNGGEGMPAREAADPFSAPPFQPPGADGAVRVALLVARPNPAAFEAAIVAAMGLEGGGVEWSVAGTRGWANATIVHALDASPGAPAAVALVVGDAPSAWIAAMEAARTPVLLADGGAGAGAAYRPCTAEGTVFAPGPLEDGVGIRLTSATAGPMGVAWRRVDGRPLGESWFHPPQGMSVATAWAFAPTPDAVALSILGEGVQGAIMQPAPMQMVFPAGVTAWAIRGGLRGALARVRRT